MLIFIGCVCLSLYVGSWAYLISSDVLWFFWQFGLRKRLSLDDGSLEVDRKTGSRRMSTSTPRRKVLSPMNMQRECVVPFSETEGLECEKTYTKEEVEMLLKDKFKGKMPDFKVCFIV